MPTRAGHLLMHQRIQFCVPNQAIYSDCFCNRMFSTPQPAPIQRSSIYERSNRGGCTIENSNGAGD